MLNVNTLKITKNIPFQLYLLSDRRVKRLCKEFEFHGVKIYREEKVKTQTTCLNYPQGNVFWFVDFKKYIKAEILDKDTRYIDDWNALLERLKVAIKAEHSALNDELSKITAKKVATMMVKYDLRDYQAHDMLQLMIKMEHNNVPAGLILSEQRTGKTRVAVATCAEKLDTGSTILVVCPKSAQVSWYTEFTQMNNYIKQELFKVTLIKKTKDIKDVMDYHTDAINVKIISYGLFKILSAPQMRQLIDFKHSKNIMFISDEAHRLRNFKTMQSDAIFEMKHCCVVSKSKLQIIGITGTPAVKDSSDVFGVFSLINFSKIQFKPHEVSFNLFKEYFYNCEDTSYGKVCKSLRRKQELTYLLETNSVQTKKDSLELFKGYEKKYLKYTLEMDSQQKEIYDSVLNTMEFGDEIDCMNGLVQLTRLQQICIDPSGLVSSYDHLAPKLKWVLEFVKKNKVQVLIMAKKRTPLDKLEQVFTDNGITYTTHNGSLSLEKREEHKSKFRNGDAQVFLIQLDSGKECLTLPEAKCTIFLDRDFAQGFNEQAEARMSPVTKETCVKYIIDLIMNGSKEEGIYNTLVVRKESIDSVNTIQNIMKGD